MFTKNYPDLPIRYGDQTSHVGLLQRYLRESVDLTLKVDLHFGSKTKNALQAFQKLHNIDPSGEFSGKTKEVLTKAIFFRYVYDDCYSQVARIVGRDVKQFTAIAKAIASVEARNVGFFENGEVLTLLERHKFNNFLLPRLAGSPSEIELIENHYQITLNPKDAKTAYELVRARNPNICNPEPGGYLREAKEAARLKEAIQINPHVALESCSMGLYQIMGFNAVHSGYDGGVQMYIDFAASEHRHLLAFAKFLESNAAVYTHLRKKDYNAIAKLYNGPGYAKNNYHTKLGKQLAIHGF